MNFGKKIAVKFTKMVSNKNDLSITQEERCLMIIVKYLIEDINSDLLMTPGMYKLYIKSDDKTLFVVVDVGNNTASIINHHFGYNIKMSQRVSTYIYNNFTKEVEKRRTIMENEYRGNIKYSLSGIINNFKKEK